MKVRSKSAKSQNTKTFLYILWIGVNIKIGIKYKNEKTIDRRPKY